MQGKLASVAIAAMRGSVLASKLVLTTFLAAYVGLDVLGQFGLIAAAVAVLPVMLGFGFVQSLGRLLVVAGWTSIAAPLRQYWVRTTIIYSICAAVSLAADAGHLVGLSTRSVALVWAVLLLEHLNNDAFQLISNLKKPLLANIQALVRTALWIAVYLPVATAFHQFRSLNALLAFWAVGVAASLWVAAAMLKRGVSEHAPGASGVHPVGFLSTWKLYVAEVCNGVGLYADRYIIGGVLGAKFAGIYVLFSSFGQGIYTLSNTSVMQVYRPHLIEASGSGSMSEFERLHTKCTKEALISASLMAVLCGVVLHVVAPALHSAAIAEHETVLWGVLAVAVIRIWSDVQGYALFTRGDDGAFAVTTVVTLLVAVFANFAGLRLWGLPGAVVASAVSFGATGLVRRSWLRRSIGPIDRELRVGGVLP